MTFSWKGELYGRPVEGTVADGKIEGPSEVVSLVEALVAAGVHVGLGPHAGPASLDDPVLAREVIAGVLDEDTAEFDGDAAPVEELPEGVEA